MLDLLIAAGLLGVPAPSAPQDDPGFAHCFKPAAKVELRWDAGGKGAATYLLVKRRDADGTWKTWVKSYARTSPFGLQMRGRLARNGDFAWMLFAVDRGVGDYAMGEWRYFCTRE